MFFPFILVNLKVSLIGPGTKSRPSKPGKVLSSSEAISVCAMKGHFVSRPEAIIIYLFDGLRLFAIDHQLLFIGIENKEE